LEIELMALEITNLRVLSADSERRAPGTEASLLKIKGSEIQQAIAELMMQTLGPDALSLQEGTIATDGAPEQLGPPYAQPLAATYSNLRKTSIYAGSNEIQKNIIARAILGR
jgi:alkylation response protein AidB-like acyl-CoA dehydrogenase